ncbi:hypothetical protein [Streptomyces sp. NPDC102462]|uniref:hypothetical protein n=1 Tax=Streptomyces sp. NPDC102462 TaxID=3366178 RepID=UPI003805AEDF
MEGFGPAVGYEAELHRYRVELPRGAEVEEFGDIVELPGLLTITLDKAGGVPVPEIVTKPARVLVRGPADGRAERSEVQAATNDVMYQLERARSGARLGQIFPKSAGYVVDPLAENLPVRINEAGYAILVHHTATAPTSRLVAFIEHVRDRMRRESPPVQIAHADAGAGIAFGAWAREDFARWLNRYPDWADVANPEDGDELEGVIALGYTQVAATVRGGALGGTYRPKDLTAVASRDSLAAVRSKLGAAPLAYLEHRAPSIAAHFASRFDNEIVVRDGSVLDLPLMMSGDSSRARGGSSRATVRQYLDNLLLATPERIVTQYQALGIRTAFHTLETNPDHRGVPRLEPPVVRMEVRSYASTEQTAQTIARDSDTLAVLSLNLYNEARLDRGLPPVGRPLAPAQPDFLFAPPARTAPSVRPAGSAVPAEPAPAPAPSPTPLPPALVEKAARLVAMDADARARELASLPWRDRELLAADRAFVEQLRAGLSVEEFTAVAARLLVVVPEGVEQPEAARAEAEALVADMLADPQIAVALLTGGRRLIVVPRNRPLTSLEEFAGLRGRHHPGGGWSADAARGLYRRRLAGVGEENLLGETTDLLGDDVYDDGYSVARQWAHAIESVLSAEDRQLIVDVYEAKKAAAVPAAQWPDGPGPNHSSSNAHEYFAQLSNAYLGANTGKDSNSRRGPRNNGSDWVEQHDPALLPLLRRLYGPGRPSNLGSDDVYDDGYSVARQWAHAIESVLSAEDRQLIVDVYEAKKAAAVPAAQWPDGLGPNHSSSNAHEYFAQLSNAYLGANTGKDSNSRRGPRNNGSDWVEQHDPALLPLLRRLYGPGRPSNLGSDDVYDDGYSIARHEWAHAIESVLSAEDRKLIRDVYEAKVAADPPAQWPDGPAPNHSSSNAHEYFAQLSNAYLGANTGKDSNSRRGPRNNGSDWVEQHDPALLPLLRRLYGPGRPSNLGSRDNPYILTGFRQLWDRAEGELTGHDSTPTPHDNEIPTQTRGVEVSDTAQQGGSDVHTEPETLPARYDGDEWVDRPSGSGRRWLRADIVDDEAVPSSVTPDGELDESPDALFAPPARSAETEPSADVLRAPAPRQARQAEETTRHAAVEAQASTAGQRSLSQEEQLAERGLAPVYVLPGGDVLAHALTAVAPGESGRLAGHSWPAGPQELRAALADALAADLGLPSDEQRLWSAVAGQAGPSGAPLVTAFGGSEGEAVRALRTGSGPEATDWLTLAVAAPVLGLRLTVLTPDGSPWTTGPETGRRVALLQQENPAPFTARWAATEPTAQARQARRPDVSQLAGASGYTWGTTSADSSTPPGTITPPASGESARPAVFFGSEPRPSTPDSQRAGTSSGTPVTRTPPAPAEEASPVSAPVAESALTPPPAEETTTPPRTARDTRDEQDADTVTIPDVPADDGTDVVPAVPREEEPPRTLSAYARPLPEPDAPSPDPDAVPPRTDGVPVIVVTSPEGEVSPLDAHRDPDPAPTGAAPSTPVTGTRDPAPWYLAHGAMGQAIVAQSTETIDFRREQADFWAEQISARLDLTGPGPHIALRSGIRTAISDLLVTAEPKEWDDILAAGRTLVVDGRLVWLRPVMRDLTPVPRTKGEVNEYPVGFGSTATGGRSGHEVSQGIESTLLTLINLGTSVAASAAAVPAPQLYVGSSKSKDSGWLRTVLTGRKPFINDLTRFGAGLQMKVFVDGADATPTVFHKVTVPDRIHIDIPTVYTGEEGHRPDYRAPEAESPRRQRASASRPHSQARELLQAIDLTPVIAGLHRNMRAAGLPASAVKKILTQAKMDRAQGFLTEPTARSRYPWWAGGDSSNGIEVSGSLFGKFRGHLRIRREIDSLQYLGDSKVGTRDDIGVGEGSTRDSQGGSDAGFGFGYNTAGVGVGGDFSVDTDAGTSPESENKLSVQLSGLAPAITFKAGVNRDVGHSLDSSHTSHTVLNDFARQSRYRAGLRLEVTLESSTHRIAPVGVTTEGELSVPQREAAHFVRRTVGSGWTADLRPAAGGADAPRHRVFALSPSWRVSKLPDTRPLFRFRMAVERAQGRLTPHPREPLALASRRGLGFGVPIALPGVETLQQDLRDAIERLHVLDVGAEEAKKSAWAQADRDLAAFYGRPALEGDVAQALLGIHRTIQVGKRRYKVSAKARWDSRIEEPSPLADPVTEENRPEGDFSMKVNTRAATGAATAGERGKGWRAAVTFGGGARLSIPEYELSLGNLHFTTPPIRMQFGSVRGLVSSSKEKSRKYGGSVGSYRRTETGKRIDEHRYHMAVNWTVTPEKKSRFKPSWLTKRRFLNGRNRFVARVVVPHEHVPATPVTPEQAQAAGHTVVGTAPTEVGRRLDFAGGAQGIYPVFHLMPELAQLGARMYAERLYAGERNGAKRRSLIDAWLDNPADWPQEIRDLAHPMVLASHFGEEVDQGGYEKELPKDGKYKQALRLRLLVDNVNDLGANSETEVEHYLKGNAAYESEQEGEWSAGVTGTVGPQLRFGSDAQDGDHPAGPGGRLTVLGQASVAWNWGKGASESDGRIDITRATYGGPVHTLRTDPVFELTYVRWRGDELTETTRYLRATEALDLLVPERRMSDILPPETGTAAGSEPRQTPATDPTAEPEQVPVTGRTAEPGQVPVTDEARVAEVTRTYLDTGLLPGIAHPELLRVDVLQTINDRLRARGIVRAEGEGATAPRPNLLQRSLKAAYSSEALQSEWHALTTEGVLRWFPVPGSWGTTRYLWVNVTATRLDRPHGQRPRDEIKLTLRGEAVEEESQSRDSGWEHDIGVAVRARAGNEKGHGGFEAEVEYSASKGTKDEDAEKKVGIYRATTQDPSEEFEHGITFRVEMGTTTELPEVLTTPAQGALSAARLFSQAEGPEGSPSVSAWHDPGDGPDQLVDGDVRLLVPRPLTVETGRPQQWPHGLTAPRETQVTWLWHSSQNPPAPALPDTLVDNLHPWTVPAAASIGRWAKLTAVRHRTVPSPQVGTVPEIAGLDLTTTAGVHYRHRTTGTVMRPRIRELLKHAYWVPLGDRSAIVGLELDGAEILGPPEGVLLKQRRYHQADEEPMHETHRDSGWRIAVGPEAGGPVNDEKMLERLAVDVKNWEDSESRSAALGDTDERNAEGKRPYRAYRFDVTAVVNGPHGTVRIKVPGGLYGALPVDKNTGRLTHGLEDDATVGPLLRPAPPATETAAERATVTAGQEGMTSLPDTVRAQPAAASGSREPGEAIPAPPTTTTTLLEAPVPARLPAAEMPSSAGQRSLSQEEQLAERGLAPVYVLPGGDVLAHALTAVAPAESGRLAGHSWPAGPEELRAALAGALAADLGLPPGEQRLWSVVAGQSGPSGVPLVAAFGGSADEAVRALRTGSGPEAADWLTLAVAAPVLGLRLSVLMPDGSLWTTGPETGRSVALLQQEDPAPYTARWAATEPTAQARQARRPDVSQLAGASGYTWGTTSADSSTPPDTTTRAAATASSSAVPADVGARTGGSPARPAAAASGGSARPAVFFGSEPRPSTPDSQRAGTSSGTPVTRTPPAQVAETSEVSAPVAESALTPPPAEEATTPPRTARDTRDEQDTDAVTILDVPADDGTDVVPAVPADEEPPRTLSPYALTYGARLDGSVGLAVYEPLSEDVLGALHQQVLDGLGVEPGSAADRAVREELAAVLSQSEIARELPQVRSARGHRVTVTVDGQERTIDVRLRLTDPALSTRAGVSGEVPRRTTLERHGEGGQSSSRSEGSGTMRTVPIPWIGIYDGPAGPLRWFDGALVLSLTHNQSSESSTVSDGLTARSMQRANDPAHAVQYTSRWQIRIDTDRNAPVDAWSPERVGGPLTVWFPEHRVFGDGGAAGPLPEPAGLDDLPLWGVDEVLDPGRLLDELRADEGFTVLNNLGADSHEELEEFLSERTLRGSLPMMRDGGVHSPVLFDRHGDSLGVLRLEATVLSQRPVAGTPDGKFSLESWLTQSSGVEQSSRLTSGVALDGSGGPMFTPDHEVGHPDAARLMGGSIMAKAGVSWQSGDALNTSSSVALMHALYTTSSHLVTPADITYRVTLIRSGGGEITGSFGPWPDGASLRLPQRSTTTGHVPTPEERRRLPEHLENLESIGSSAVPLAPEGTGPMFDRAETWLRREGFLPSAERESVFNETRAEQQLENLRRFAQLRSRLGQAAAMPDAVDGGRPLWFELPDHVSGGMRRVQLRFSATRDRTPPGAQAEAALPPAAHVRRLPDVDTVTFLSLEARGDRQRSNQFGGTVGAGGGPRFPVDGGAAALDATGDFTWGRRHETATSAGSASGVDPFNITLDAGTELFEIPALFTLDLYEGTAEEPTVRFAAEPTPEPALGADPEAIQSAVPAPPFATGRVRLVVPHHRTLPWDSRPVVPAAPHRVRAPITGGGQDDDHVRLGLTDEAGRPREGLLRLPDDANVDVFRGSAALQEAFRQIVTGTYPGHPAVGTFGQWAQAAASQLPGAVTGPGNRLRGYLTGPAVEDQQAFAGEALFQQLRAAGLLARAAQIFNGVYVMEGLTLPGLLADQELSVEIAGYLHNPTYHGSYNTYAENNIAAKDMSAQGRSVTTSHQYGGALSALQSPPPPASDGTPQRASLANPSVRGVYTHRTARTSERSAGSSVVRTPTQAAEHHLIGADATLLLTLRQGTRNVAMNVAGLGEHDDITLAIDLPRAVRFQLSDSQLVRFEHWFTGVPELPRPVVQPDTVPLPEHYVVSGDIGFASVLSVTQLDDPIRRNESRDRLRRELLTLVEREAPGVTRPGHVAYRRGVAARIADMTSPAGLRALPGRRRVSLWFRHAGRHGSRLVEVVLSAEPVAQPPARREVRGRPAGTGVGIDQIASHAPGNRSESATVTRSVQVSANPISRYPRPQARSGRTDRTGPVLSGTGTRGRSSRTARAAQDTYWARTENAADFDDIDYTITATVRAELLQDWPPDLVGGALESGLLTLTDQDGGTLIARIGRLLRGRPAHQVRIPAAVSLRFAGSEAVAPRRHAPAVRPRITQADPRLPAPQAPLPLGGPTFTAGSRLIPTGATPVYGFNAFHELAEALRTVAPRLSGSWGLTADLTPEAAAFRLGELVQAGEIPVEAPRTAAGLTPTMPGAWPVESEPVTPRLQVTLHNPRPITEADDIAVDRLRVTSHSVGSSASAESTAGLGYQWTQSGNDANMHLVSFTLPVLNRQPLSRAGGVSASAGGWDRVKTGSAAASGTEPATRSYETMVDVVITVTGEETRYVTGSAIARVYERDLLGYGVTAPRTASQVYDLPSMLSEQPNDTLRNWRTHPVTELPAVLARGLDERENAAQLWLHLGADPDGTALARALYVGSRTAVAAGRPVELVVRGATGLRFWPFGADGSLVDLTPATQDTWNRLRAAIVTATDATAAEADQVARETELVPREAEAESRLANSRRELTTATEARDAAAAAHATARSARDSLADRLRDAEAARAAAEEEAAPYAAAVTTAEQRLAQTEQAVLDARREVEQEAARLRLLTADGHEPTPQAGPGPRAALAEARAERDSARDALGRAQDMADVARRAVDRATEKVGDLGDRLAAADEQMREAALRERDAEDAVTRATSARDQHYRDHRQLQEELRDARRQQADQQRLWEDAWRAMPGQSGMLSADRCREGVGGARYPLGSLS